jgi:hypothetical protein
MNFRQMTDRVKYTLGMQEIVAHDEIAFIKAYLNEGLLDVIVRTRPYTRVITLTLTANVPIHDMSTDILALLDVEMPGTGFLSRFSREDITKLQASGGYGFAYEEPLLWISPVPSVETQIKAYGIFRPSPMVGDADDPASPNYGGLPPEFHTAIIDYACWKAAEYTQHEQSAMGEKWRIAYEGKDGTEGDIARIKRILTKRVTPQAARRRDLSGNLGSLSASGSYMGG